MSAYAELKSAPRARKVVALLKSESDHELASLIAEHGGSPMSVPAVSASLYAELEEVRAVLDELAADRYEIAVFMTGSSVSCLFDIARELGKEAALASALRRVTTICRGPKARAALRGLGFEQALRANEPLSDARLIHSLVGLTPAGRSVLRFNGDQGDGLREKLAKRRSQLRDVSLSHRRSATDVAAATTLVERIAERRVDALLVLCELQFRHLYQVAWRLDRSRDLVHALRNDIVVATVGERCQEVVEAHGVRPHAMPAQPRMLVLALLRFLDKREPRLQLEN